MLVVPLQPVPAQIVSVALNNQACTIRVRQVTTGMFIDLYVNNALIIGGVICEDRNVIVRDAYLGFIGDLAFLDTQGDTENGVTTYADPVYTGVGTRFILGYFAPSELPAGLS